MVERAIALSSAGRSAALASVVSIEGSSKRRPGAKKPQPKIVAKKVAKWVHTLGLSVGKGARKAPNHAWRHFFRTLARDAKVADSVASAILGHRPATVGEGYGETRLTTKAEAIESMGLASVLADKPTG